MDKENTKRVKYNVNRKINAKKSKHPMAKISYRELQAVAADRRLPARLKHKELLALVIAHMNGRDDIMKLILDNNKIGYSTKDNIWQSYKNINLEPLHAPSCSSSSCKEQNNSTTSNIVDIIDVDKDSTDANKENIEANPRQTLKLKMPSSCTLSSGYDSFSTTITLDDMVFEENLIQVSDDDVAKALAANLDNDLNTPSPDAFVKFINLFEEFNGNF